MTRPAFILIGTGLVALILGAVLAVFDLPLAGAYLLAWMFWIGLPLGALAILMMTELIGGSVESELGPVLRDILKLIFPLAPLILPILFLLPHLYPWAGAQGDSHALYYSQAGFILRNLLFLAIWIVLALGFVADPTQRPRRQWLAGIGAALHSLLITAAAVDWGMSLVPHWSSSIYGLILLAGQMLGAFALAILLRFMTVSAPEAPKDIGTLLFAGAIIWFYVQFMQYLVFYTGDLPSEIPWLQQRQNGLWLAVMLLTTFCEFVLPFIALMPADARASRRLVVAMAAVMLIGHLGDTVWLIAPSLPQQGHQLALQTVIALLGLGALAMGCAATPARRLAALFANGSGNG